jgi:hypothetical protein
MAEVASKNRNGVPAEVHALLVLWGNYTRHSKEGPQGYPRESPFIKSALYGKLGIPQESNVRVEEAMPNLVEWMDRIVAVMPVDLNEVIIARYRPPLNAAGNEPAPDLMAKSLGMSLSTFRSQLQSAQWYVYARMYP